MAKSNALKQSRGSIEVICGPMFAGKSDELIRTLHKWKYADIEYLVFKPIQDSRSNNEVKSRNGLNNDAYEIKDPIEILEILQNQNKKINVIAIDEAQFFDLSIVDIVDLLANQGFSIIISGLDCDFRGEPFGPMPYLLAKADYVNKLTAICIECGALATKTQRLINNIPASSNDPLILVGNTESYTARCRNCHKINDAKTDELIKKYQKIFTKK